MPPPIPPPPFAKVQAAQGQSLHFSSGGEGEWEGALWFGVELAQDHASVPLCCVAFWGWHIAAVLLQYCCSTDTTTATVLLQ